MSAPPLISSTSSHDMASVCITEAVDCSLRVNKEPCFVLFLDAKSAFDRVLIQHVSRCLYFAGTEGEGLKYIEQRLLNRNTFIQWKNVTVGSIQDTLGLEQGVAIVIGSIDSLILNN